MSSRKALRKVFMGGVIVEKGQAVPDSKILKAFNVHFEDVKGVKPFDEQAEKLKIETEGKLYGVDLDRRLPISKMKIELAKAKEAAKAKK